MADSQSFSSEIPVGWVYEKVVYKKDRPIPVYFNQETGQRFWGKEALLRYVRYLNVMRQPQERRQQLTGSPSTSDASSTAFSSTNP